MEEKKKRGVGCPRAFLTGEIFEAQFKKYLLDCEAKNKLANIRGFCVFSRISRMTYYACKEYYPFEFELVENILEDETINNKSLHPSILGRYLGNKFNITDKQQIENRNIGMTIDEYFNQTEKENEY